MIKTLEEALNYISELEAENKALREELLDVDLTRIYGYETKAFNQQVKRNIERFPIVVYLLHRMNLVVLQLLSSN